MASDRDGALESLQADDLVFDLARRRVLRRGEVLKITGLTLAFLHILMERSPRVVSYDELAKQVWGGRAVTPETIAQRAKLLRDALDDDASDPRYVELVRGHGYRLIPAVTSVEDTAGAATSRQRRGFRAGVAALLALIAAALLVALRQLPAPSVAVLPFTDLSAAGDHSYFGDGLAEQLIDELTRLEGVRVASRTSSFRYRDSGADARAVGDALDVTTILEGSVRRSGNTLRITAQLIDAGDGYHLWSDSFDRPMGDLLIVQDEIAAAVAGVLGVSLGIHDANAFRGAGTSSIEAYEAYLRALREPADGDRRRLLERALQFDPDYGAALASLGLLTASSMWWNPVEEAPRLLAEARPLIMRAVELDPGSAHAVALRAVTSYPSREWEQSEALFREAERIRPSGDILSHHANMLMRTGRSSKALSQYKAAASAATRPARRIGAFYINALLALGHYAEIDALIADDRLVPGLHRSNLVYLLALNRGDTEALKRAFDQLVPAYSPFSERFAALRDAFDSPDRALAILRDLLEDDSRRWPAKYHDIALHAAFFGDADLALEAFAIEVRLTAIRYGALWYPVMGVVRRLPGFASLMSEVQLAPYWRRYGWPDHCEPVDEKNFRCF
jgi:TolB-like protein/tetratricopeptide (TPR) repeat protein